MADAYVAGKISPVAISFHFEEETLPVPYIPYQNPFL